MLELLAHTGSATSLLTVWRPPLPYGYSYKASCARPDEAGHL